MLALAALCVLAAVVAFVGSSRLSWESGIAWRAWLFEPFLGAALRPVPVLLLVSLVLLNREMPRFMRVGLVATAVLVVVSSFVPAVGEWHARWDIRPTLVREAAAVVAPPGVVVSGQPRLSRVDDGPGELRGGPQATWFWPLTPGQPSACAVLRSTYQSRPGWSFDAVSCSAIRQGHRWKTLVEAFGRADLAGSLTARPGAPTVPGVEVVVIPADGSSPF